jgi:hypothetical protein
MNILKITNPNRKWHEIILWWEIRRLPYNAIMYLIGYLSFHIAFVTIPLVYLVIGLALNILYSFGWIIELIFINKGQNETWKLKYPKYAFVSYLILSSLLVIGVAIFS